MRQTFYEDRNIMVQIEEAQGVIFVHCYIEGWKLSVARKLFSVFRTLEEVLRQQGVKRVFTASSNFKFVEFLGLKRIDTVEDYKDGIMGVYVWELD